MQKCVTNHFLLVNVANSHDQCKIRKGHIFALSRNSQSHGFLLEWLDSAPVKFQCAMVNVTHKYAYMLTQTHTAKWTAFQRRLWANTSAQNMSTRKFDPWLLSALFLSRSHDRKRCLYSFNLELQISLPPYIKACQHEWLLLLLLQYFLLFQKILFLFGQACALHPPCGQTN